ncbi:YceI family protein [Rhodococcus marinonascens]|uniref:YceI family protein n=1 Tax=Rhodococcus marinonascens TaxID=38311 RepID=UPI000934710D|nr:YceI family protein [Rhodococcus marinonascens]
MTTATAALPNLASGTWAIDPTHSSIGFSVRHLMVSKVRGTFNDFTGAITVTEDGIASVNAEIQVSSIDTKHADRDAHLASADYFGAEQFPTATFTSTAIRAQGDDYVVEGEFTLHGVTRPVALALAFNGVNPGMGHGAVAGFEATTEINRKDFGITVDMPLETGGVVVGDKISIILEIEASLQG